jgi:ArsR family transcriptional regulator, arsenate/arsenite/antimonite-responsive transcriptional repressor
MKAPKCNCSEEGLELLNILSDRTRQEIITVFAHSKELRANDIAKKFSLSRPTVSHHLNLMKRAGVLKARKDGKEIYYSFNKAHVVKMMKSMTKVFCKCC